jgi:small subunit ribosomal protein S3
MWHKVSPWVFRIPYVKNWSANWFADKKDYASHLLVDTNIRSILKKSLKDIPTGDIIISRNQAEVLVTIYTAKTALVLWRDEENVNNIKAEITKKTWVQVKILVKEIKKPDLNSKVIWFMISNQIEKRMPYKRVIKQAIAKAMEKWAKWVKVKVWWRLNGVEIARRETFKEWNIPTQTIRADIDYTTVRAETVYGTIWIKVWVYKGDIFKRK